jgi:S1-C subfamily serine protease
MSYETEGNRTEISMEQTKAVWYENFKPGHSSSLEINVLQGLDIIAHGSGNYFKIGKERFIITAAHVVNDGTAFFIRDKGEFVFMEIIYIDPYKDIAILIPMRELFDCRPHNYNNNNKKDILGMSVNYTGYPGQLGKATFRGIVSKSGINYAILQSFAIPGSSGSVVFDNSGKVVGVVSAVSVGVYFPPLPQLDENIVYIERLYNINRKFIKERIKEWRKGKISP